MHEFTSIYNKIKDRIDGRLLEFERIGNYGTEEDYFTELVFCILTPQTKARQAEKAVRLLQEKHLIFEGKTEELSKILNIVRFRNHKAEYIVNARNVCFSDGKPAVKALLGNYRSIQEKRVWLVTNIKGYGYKEASHFLRNIGLGKDLAILDRHIVRNLVRAGILAEEPANLSGNNYIEIEKIMCSFSETIGIPMVYLDFVLWYNETGDIFK